MNYALSVLDQSPIAEGASAADAVRNSIALAQACDFAGYKRFWVAEHHASRGLASVAPEAMIGPVALATKRIKVGSGGVMLPHYSPFKVAEIFKFLAALAPDRIDMGIGRAAGTDLRASFALQRDRSMQISVDDFPYCLTELLAYLGDGLPADHPFSALKDTLPSGGGKIEPWLLGSSVKSAEWAAEEGVPYCIADFINQNGTAQAEFYKSNFESSRWIEKPYLMVAVWAIAADCREEAEGLALSARMVFSHLAKGEVIPVPSVEKALYWARNNGEALGTSPRMVVGSPSEVKAGLDLIASLYGADEMMLVNIIADHDARVHSYELIANEFGLAGKSQQ
jgi:luciferase family oxidoreductase group 1